MTTLSKEEQREYRWLIKQSGAKKKAIPGMKHGMRFTPEYDAWCRIKARCFNPKCPQFKDWGGRGITMADEWLHDPIAFYQHVGPRPTDKHSIDRIDVNGNYEPGNVKWSTALEQGGNKRWHRWVTYKGKTKPLNVWAREVGITREKLRYRLDKGWRVRDAFRK